MRSESPSAEAATTDGSWEEILAPRCFAAGFGILVVVSFYSVLLAGQSFVLRDFSVFGYPLADYHRQAFWAGEIPLWNPLSYGGIPFLAQWNTMTLYPGSLLYLLLPMPWSLNFFCVVHLYLAGLGMYFLLRHWTGSNISGTVAGLAFGFGGLVQNSLMWPNNIAAFGWLPWVLLAVQLGVSEGGRCLFVAMLAGAIQMLTGAPEVILFTWLLAGVLFLALALPDRETIRRAGRRFTLIVLAVAALCAIQLLPFFDLLSVSERATAGGTDAWAIDFDGWVNLLAPLFETRTKGIGAYFHDSQAWTHSFYVGGAVLWLAVVALTANPDTRTKVLLGTLLVAYWLATGSKGWLYGWVAYYTPLDMIRYPVKWVIVLSAGLPMLAGLGMRALLRGAASGRASMVIGIAVAVCLMMARTEEPDNLAASEVTQNLWLRLFAAAGIVGLLVACVRARDLEGKSRMIIVAVLVLWADLRWHQPNLHPTIDRNWYGQPNPSLPTLSAETVAGVQRMHPSRSRQEQNLFAADASLLDAFKLVRISMFNNWNLVEGTAKMNGFYSLWLPTQRTLADALHQDPAQLPGGLADFLGIEYVSPTENTIDWIRRPNVAPLVQVGQELRPATNIMTQVFSPEFDGSKVAYFEDHHVQGAKRIAASSATVTNVMIGSAAVSFTVRAPAETVATVAHSFHHGWQAAIDGERAELLKVNIGAQAVVVPAGEHQVEIRYEDDAFVIGRWITLLTLCVLAWRWRALRPDETAKG